MEGHVIADEGVSADGDMVDAHQLDHVVIVVEDAVDVLVGVVAEGVGDGGDGDEAALPGAGDKLVVPAGAPGGAEGVGGVVAVDDRGF